MAMGFRLKELRFKLRMTQMSLAIYLGCSQTLVSQWETDKKVPSTDVIKKIKELIKFKGIRFRL